MKMFPMLILVIGVALTASLSGCATPVTPAFPAVDCVQVKLTKSELQELKACNKNVAICNVRFDLMKKIFLISQEDKSCLEQYKAGASKFKG